MQGCHVLHYWLSIMVKIKKSRKRKTPQKTRQSSGEQLAYGTSQELLQQALHELRTDYPPEQLEVEEVLVFDHAACLLRERMARKLGTVSLDSARVLLMTMMLQANGMPKARRAVQGTGRVGYDLCVCNRLRRAYGAVQFCAIFYVIWHLHAAEAAL